MFKRKPSTQAAPEGDHQGTGSPEALPTEPFNVTTCTLAVEPTGEEKAALEEHISSSPTRAEFWQRSPRADWMLDLLRGHSEWIPIVPEVQLRRFALACVEGLAGADRPSIVMLLQGVEGRVTSTASLSHLEALRRQTQLMVSSGGAHGLPRCRPDSAGALAAWHAATPNPYEAAYWTAEFAARHDAFVVVRHRSASWRSPDDRGEPGRKSWQAAFFSRAHSAVYQHALAEARHRQAMLLRSILPDPFVKHGPPVRADVYFSDATQNDRVSMFCLDCGHALKGVSPGVLFDARGEKCFRCGRPLGGQAN